MLHLTPDEMSGSLLVPELFDDDSGSEFSDHALPPRDLIPVDGGDAGAGGLPPTRGATSDHPSLTRDIDDLLRETDRRRGGPPTPAPLAPPPADPSATRREQLADE